MIRFFLPAIDEDACAFIEIAYIYPFALSIGSNFKGREKNDVFT